MSKAALFNQVIAQLENTLQEALQAADEAHQNATHSESTAETQYDTLGLENAYLAHGQSMRVEVLNDAISRYQQLPLRELSEDDPITTGALVRLERETDGLQRHFLIGPMQGGLTLEMGSETVMLITPQTPVGEQLMERFVGDLVSLPDGDYEIAALA